MSGEKSEATILTEMLAEELEEMYQAAIEALDMPFGMEKIDKETYRRRFKSMPREQKVQEIMRAGAANMLEMFPEGVPWDEEA